MVSLWNANTYAQYILNAYAATSYCSSYTTKLDRSMTSAFKKIHIEHEKRKINPIEMIRTLEIHYLTFNRCQLNHAVHITLSMPLNSSSRQCVFINTSPSDEGTFILKPNFLLKQEPDNSEDIMCRSIIDYYVARPIPVKHILLSRICGQLQQRQDTYVKEKETKCNRICKL